MNRTCRGLPAWIISPGTAQVVGPFPERLAIVPFRTFRHRRDIVRCLPDKRLQHFQPVAILQQRMEIDLLLLPFVAQASCTDLQQALPRRTVFSGRPRTPPHAGPPYCSPEAVAAMTGMVREFPTLAVRSSFNTSNPFICGIFKSVIIRS